jgi:hypothetical protein
VHRAAVTVLILTANFAGNQAVAGAPSQDAPPAPQEQKSELPSQDSPKTAEHQGAPGSDSKLVLQDGTPVRLRFVRAVVSSVVIAGETINLEVVEKVRLGDLVAIPEHSPAMATVTLAQAKRAMGRGGNLELKIDTVRLANGEFVPLRTIKDVTGGGSKGAMVGGMVATGLVFLPAAPLLLFVRGKNAVIPEGTEITVYVNGDISLDPAKFPAAGTGTPTAREKAVRQERSEAE